MIGRVQTVGFVLGLPILVSVLHELTRRIAVRTISPLSTRHESYPYCTPVTGWLLYTVPGPADPRTVVSPPTDEHPPTGTGST